MKKITDDRFKEYADKASSQQTKLSEWLGEREFNVRSGKQSTRVDYLIKNEIESAEQNMRNLDKLAFLYQSKPQEYPDIQPKELTRRVAQVTDLKAKMDASLKQARDALGLSMQAKQVDLESQPLVVPETMEGKGNVQVL